ncbi:MAG: hypothetical protein KC619_36130, partial [Myxococcales bacterium]|nr:hypothetical protein [Myxococcales bacterium]
MTPEEANRMALGVVREVLAAAHGFELEVDGRRVQVEVFGRDPSEWPKAIPGLDPEVHGPWPPRVNVRCRWDGGEVELACVALAGRDAKEPVVICARHYPVGRYLGFSNVSKALLASDEPELPVVAAFHLKKRRHDRELQTARNRKLRDLVGRSGLPMLTDWSVELMRIRAEDGAILPDASTVFERLVRLNLFKLDFFSRGNRAAKRGAPLIDLDSLGLGDAEEDDQPGEEEEADERHFWAGGFAEEERLQAFLAGDFWQLGWTRDDDGKGAQQSWARFAKVEVGDGFAIKGFAGNQLTVHYLGEVVAKDEDAGRLDLKPLRGRSFYKGPAPRGSGGGSWLDILVPITREDVVELLFGDGRSGSPTLGWTGPKNVILYGPPGTGKTYRLRDDFRPRFTREAERRSIEMDRVRELSWFEIVAAALADQGGEATAMELREHPFVKAKQQSVATNTPVLARIWGSLQGHTVEESTTVNYGRRYGRLIFDKRADGTWFFPADVPEDIAELPEALHPRPALQSDDYVFVTFHQSYAYEDFIEGIRPKTAEGDGDAGPSLTYELEDGVFLRAANAAVRLAGFDGTIDDLCRLPAEQRTEILEGAPPYGVFIDEINRGNVSRIFGELITLL